jgi:guanylate kinase
MKRTLAHKSRASALDVRAFAKAGAPMEIASAFQRRGLLYVLSSPSGAGKSTIARMLMENDEGVAMSVSATTRPIRPGETDGHDYHFVSDEQFDEMVGQGAFLEWAHVFGHRYGTLKSEVMRVIEGGRDVLLDIDWQGTQQLKQVDPDIVRVFILPPSMAELERRLRNRATDSDEVVRRRMERAAAEISHWAEYDYVLINDHMERCLGEVRSIVAAERLKTRRHTGLVDFVRGLGPA